MSEQHGETSARDGWMVFLLSLALWGGLLGTFLYVGHRLGVALSQHH